MAASAEGSAIKAWVISGKVAQAPAAPLALASGWSENISSRNTRCGWAIRLGNAGGGGRPVARSGVSATIVMAISGLASGGASEPAETNKASNPR